MSIVAFEQTLETYHYACITLFTVLTSNPCLSLSLLVVSPIETISERRVQRLVSSFAT